MLHELFYRTFMLLNASAFYYWVLAETYLEKLLPGANWSSMVYEQRKAPHTKACKCICSFFTGQCNGFVFDEDEMKCYLTRYQVDGDLLMETTSQTWFYLKGKAALIVGGHDSTLKTDGIIRTILRDNYNCKSQPLPNLNELTSYETAIITHDPYVLVNGGFSYVQEAILATGFIMDLSAPERKWEQSSAMIHRRMSHQLFNLGDRIAVVGGFGPNQPQQQLEVYDLITHTWSLLRGSDNKIVTLPASINCLANFCLLENDQSVFIVGGRDCSLGDVALSDCLILDKSSLQFFSCPKLKNARYSFGCMMKHDYGPNSQMTNPRIYIRGGFKSDNIPENSMAETWLLSGSEWITSEVTDGLSILKPGRIMSFGTNGVKGYDLWAFPGYGLGTNVQIFKYIEDDSMKLQALTSYFPLRAFPSQTMIDASYFWTCPHQSQEWILLQSQNMPYTFSAGSFDHNSHNIYDDVYSNMSNLESLRSCDNYFYFRLVWPRLGYYNEWRQESNPTTQPSVTGFQRIALRFSKYFVGLFKLEEGPALMSANDMALNSNGNSWKVGTILAPNGNVSLIWAETSSVRVDRQKLFVRNIC